VPLFREYVDPTLVDLYDTLNPHGADTDFYLGLAAELGASAVLDVGCGTGLLARALARQGHRVTGVDPAPAMIEFARGRPGAEAVRWETGDVGQLAGLDADLAVLTGHVCQVIADDGSWLETLRGAFESRNPGARIWRDWTPEATLGRIPDGRNR
jgi:SAM-dependent methyltransferase